MPPATRQLTLQLAAFILVLSLAWPIYGLHAGPWPWLPLSLAIGGCAGLLAWLTRQPWWWRLIHCLFVPLAYGAAQLHLPPLVYLVAFMVLMLVYRGAVTGRVPLYFSNAITAQALLAMGEQQHKTTLLDLGAGIGSLIYPIARQRPDWQLRGLENAPLTWLIGLLRGRGKANVRLEFGDLWQRSLAEENWVYTFLSPEPMAELGVKAAEEMPADGLLVSNSFPIPWAQADWTATLGDRRATRLYCYRAESLRQALAVARQSAENPDSQKPSS